jgi:ankyrin repeat protein
MRCLDGPQSTKVDPACVATNRLHWAVCYGHQAAARALILAGADQTATVRASLFSPKVHLSKFDCLSLYLLLYTALFLVV